MRCRSECSVRAVVGGVAHGHEGTASVTTCPGLTEKSVVRVPWYPDRKHFLPGKRLPDSLPDRMEVQR